jgi:hypothetical protein
MKSFKINQIYRLFSYESSSNINRTIFLKHRYSRVKRNQFTGSWGGDAYNRHNISLRVYLLFVDSDHSEWQVVLSAVAERIIGNFLTLET